MLGDATICKATRRFKFTQSNINTGYFKYVCNVFANVVGCIVLNTKQFKEEKILYTHTFSFVVPVELRDYWYPDG